MSTIRQTVQPGTAARLRVEVDTDPSQVGKAGAFSLKEAVVTISGVASDLGWLTPAMVERAYRDGGATAETDGDPVFTAGGGFSGENVWDITVDDSSSFVIGDFVRAQLQPDGQGAVYEVLDLPDGTTIVVHGPETGFDIADGDTVEVVEPTGVYVGYFDFIVDDYMNSGSTAAEIRVIMRTVATGDAPKFDVPSTLTWTFDLTLDVGSRQYVTG